MLYIYVLNVYVCKHVKTWVLQSVSILEIMFQRVRNVNVKLS